MCCTLSGVTSVAIAQLLRAIKPDRLWIEPSGLGHPAQLVDVLKGEHLASALDLQPIICLVGGGWRVLGGGMACKQPNQNFAALHVEVAKVWLYQCYHMCLCYSFPTHLPVCAPMHVRCRWTSCSSGLLGCPGARSLHSGLTSCTETRSPLQTYSSAPRQTWEALRRSRHLSSGLASSTRQSRCVPVVGGCLYVLWVGWDPSR